MNQGCPPHPGLMRCQAEARLWVRFPRFPGVAPHPGATAPLRGAIAANPEVLVRPPAAIALPPEATAHPPVHSRVQAPGRAPAVPEVLRPALHPLHPAAFTESS